MPISHTVPARVGLLGNPSDGYGGRTLGLAVDAFSASVELEPADGVVFEPNADDHFSYDSVHALVDRVDRFGLGTGPQVLAATARTFVDVLSSIGAPMPPGFRVRYESTIPRQVGLAGSSALVVAALRCLAEHAGVEVPAEVLPSVALRVEIEQLGITAGLQDRVVQTYGGLVAMDFSSMTTETRFGVAHGSYEVLDPSALPSLFLAYRSTAAEPSGRFHGNLRARFEEGEPLVRSTMARLAALVTEGRAALRWGDQGRFGELMAENMELRRGLGPLPARQIEMVDLANSLDAPANFAGSGGAVVGVFDDDAHFDRLAAAFSHIDAATIRLTESS